MSPRPLAVVGPVGAWLVMRETSSEQWRAAALRLRKAGNVAAADELEDSWLRLREGADWVRAGSGGGSAEAASAEVGPVSEVPSSLGTAQVAGLLGCSERWVRMLIADEQLSATWVSGRWVIGRDAVDEYLVAKEADDHGGI